MSRAGWILTAGATVALAIAGATAAAAHDGGCCTMHAVDRHKIVVPGGQVVVRDRIVVPEAVIVRDRIVVPDQVVIRDRIVVPDREVVRTRIVIPLDVSVMQLQDTDDETRAVLRRTGRTVGRAVGRSLGRSIGRMFGRDPAAHRARGVEADLLFDLRHVEGSV